MNVRLLGVALAASLVFAACGGNPAWTGPDDSENPGIQLAEKACDCIYEVLDEQTEISVSGIIAEADDWARALKGEAVDPEKLTETSKLLELDETLSQKVDQSSCMDEVDTELMNKGVAFEDLMDLIDKNCKLGMFYN